MDSDKITIKVEGPGAGRRLDVFLAAEVKGLTSRSHIKRLIDGGLVLVNNEPAKPHHKLRQSEVITIDLASEKRSSGAVAENIPLEILYEDDHLLVVNKPAGTASHPSPGINTGTLVNALLYHCEKLSRVGPQLRPGIVHRLDKDTSGLMVVAKDDEAHMSLAEQFKDRKTKKVYLAFTSGLVEQDTGVIDAPIGRHPSQRQKLTVRFSNSRDAQTAYRVAKRFRDATMVELTPKTGRMHQLRVHLAYIGHPILGDAVYGQKSSLISRQALHAATLGFTHPVTGKYLEFNAPLPEDMKRLIDLL